MYYGNRFGSLCQSFSQLLGISYQITGPAEFQVLKTLPGFDCGLERVNAERGGSEVQQRIQRPGFLCYPKYPDVTFVSTLLP